MPVMFYTSDGKLVSEIKMGGTTYQDEGQWVSAFFAPPVLTRIEYAQASADEVIICCKILERNIPPDAGYKGFAWWMFIGEDARKIAANWRFMVPEFTSED